MTLEEQKECKDCGVLLPTTEYYFSSTKNRYFSRCKSCYAVHRKPASETYKRKNPDKIKESTRKQSARRREEKKQYSKEYHAKNREQALIYRKEWYNKQDREAQLQKRRDWYKANKEKHAEARKKYAIENKDKLLAARRKWENERLSTDVAYCLAKTLRSRIRAVTKGVYKEKNRTEELIGCTIEDFKFYIESQFLDGMSWDNWSFHGWHLDHRIPLSWFDLENGNCRKLAFHYTNMQPLWSTDNYEKKNKFHHQLYQHDNRRIAKEAIAL